MSLKQRVILNMIVTAIGFTVLMLLSYFSMENSYLVVIIGLLCILINLVLELSLLKSLRNNLNTFNQYFGNFLDFITYKTNKITKIEERNSTEFSTMLNQISSVADDFDKRMKDDMKVIGEIVLTMDKVEQGIFRCRVKSDTKNPMIRTLKNTINASLESLEHSMKDLQRVTTAYTNNNFKDKLDIPPHMKARLLAVMEGVNTLGKTLGDIAKQNLQNGELLENNASIMKNSMQNLASKANE